jgi:hypothetical protein
MDRNLDKGGAMKAQKALVSPGHSTARTPTQDKATNLSFDQGFYQGRHEGYGTVRPIFFAVVGCRVIASNPLHNLIQKVLKNVYFWLV